MEIVKSYRPLVVVALVSMLAVGLSFVFIARHKTVVRAAGVIYPRHFVELRSPVSLGRVIEVLKAQGDSVAAGDLILRLDAEDELFLKQQTSQRIAGLQSELKEREELLAQRKVNVDLAKATHAQALADVEVAKAQTLSAAAMLKRASPESTATLVRLAAEKLQYAVKYEEEAKINLENYVNMRKGNAVSDFDLRRVRLEYERAQALTAERREEMTLLKETEVVFKHSEAVAEVQRCKATETAMAAKAAVSAIGIRTAEMLVNIDERSRLLASEVERLKIEEQRIDKIIREKVLRAPAPGVLSEFSIQNGSWISNRVIVGTLYDTSELVVYAHVHQKDFGRIAPGQKARILFEALAGKEGAVEAEVLKLEPLTALPKINPVEPIELFSESKGTYLPYSLVKLKLLPGPHAGKLRVGFTGSVKILTDENSPLANLFF